MSNLSDRPEHRSASRALLAERAEHNTRVSTRIAPLAAAAGLIMLVQHVTAPTPAARSCSWTWTTSSA